MRNRRRNARKVAKIARALAVLGDQPHTAQKARRRVSVSLNA
ncbi:MAG TPA: hypothetical protein VFI01_11225 [Gaiellaceae bacterium]|jgi:hypothetical protein|nr:hypothetical protein [Gaiellaceae bacterium]